MIQCLHWGKGSIPTPGAHSAAMLLGKGLTVHYLVFSLGLKIEGPVSVHTSHFTHVKYHLFKTEYSHLSNMRMTLKKRPTWNFPGNLIRVRL